MKELVNFFERLTFSDLGILIQLFSLYIGFFKPQKFMSIAPSNWKDLEKKDTLRYFLAIFLASIGGVLQLTVFN